ncbi:MAG: 16S rRNA (adenine(1518)-N(6)/adenine(1519)-N(6))-dimethyltransferase [Firmicutes bacterium]|nr:16S rRNA (adenine(1518)-N(6)/adenine(1519)-N(6))-dimethyltransferase [Bacillota bacterium]
MDFKFKKRYGQNFITDTNLLRAIVRDAGVTANDHVIEVGAGAGALTRELACAAASVTAFEIDRELEPILTENLKDLPNVRVIYEDILEVRSEELETYKVVSNLPYYITTPVIFKFLECGRPPVKPFIGLPGLRIANLGEARSNAARINASILATPPPVSMTLMVQREVADRLAARPKTPEYGALTVSVQARCSVTFKRAVPRAVFKPAPDVDSAVVRLDTLERAVPANFSALVRAAFSMRRKTLVNNLMAGFGMSREQACEALAELGKGAAVRAEELSPEEFIALAQCEMWNVECGI